MIKKVFAIFCAFCLMPLVSAQAWIGGPFSNNSYFGSQGDDGVYEAVGTAVNGLGLFRIVVGNSFDGVNSTAVTASISSTVFATGTGTIGALFTGGGLNSGNIFFGGLGSNFSNIWYYQGVAYFGNTLGTVNSVQGIAVGVGNASDNPGTAGANTISSFFQAVTTTSGKFLPSKPFNGTGELRTSLAPAVAVPFTVFGSKVSDEILFGL